MTKRTLKNFFEGISGAVAIGVALITPFLNSRRASWGSTDEELRRRLPGDELVPTSTGGYNHAITINAAAADVWPWLIQIGQDRGGFYSYELLENLAGCKMVTADRIIPEFQHREVGDKVPMHPTNGVPYEVVDIVPNKAMVCQMILDIQTGKTFDLTDPRPDEYQIGSWTFFLEELNDGTTRLISRSRNEIVVGFGARIGYGFLGLISIIMDKKMLQGIKFRAENNRP